MRLMIVRLLCLTSIYQAAAYAVSAPCACNSDRPALIVQAVVPVIVKTLIPYTYALNNVATTTTVEAIDRVSLLALATQGSDGLLTAMRETITFTADTVPSRAAIAGQAVISVRIAVAYQFVTVYIVQPTVFEGGERIVSPLQMPSTTMTLAGSPRSTSVSTAAVPTPFLNSTMATQSASTTRSSSSTTSQISALVCPTDAPTLVIEVVDQSSGVSLGYIANVQNSAGNYGILSNMTTALRVKPEARDGLSVSDGRFSLFSPNAASPQYPYFGATRSLDNEDPPGFRTFSQSSGNYADLDGTLRNDGNPANSDPSATSRSAVDSGGGFNESPIWTFAACTGATTQLIATWQNDDGSLFSPAVIVMSVNNGQPNLLITGNVAMYSARDDTQASDRIVDLIPRASN